MTKDTMYSVALPKATTFKAKGGKSFSFTEGKEIFVKPALNEGKKNDQLINVTCPFCGFQDSVLTATGTVCNNCGAVIY